MAAFSRWSTVPVAPLSISHQGQFPAITTSFNLAPNVALGQAVEAINRAKDDLGCRPPSMAASRATPRRSRIR